MGITKYLSFPYFPESLYNKSMPRPIRFIVFLTIFLLTVTNIAHSEQFTESDWQVAFNKKVTHGKLEAKVSTGRIDILTKTHAIEVDYVRNYREAINQALRYAQETEKKPAVALIRDTAQDTVQAVEAGRKLAEEAGVTFWLVNDYVKKSDLTHGAEEQYWLNTKTGVRHNRKCRWFGNTEKGRFCGPDEGRPCLQCGG